VSRESLAVLVGSRTSSGAKHRGPRDHRDAINRAGRHTQLAAGAECRDDRVHLLARAHDCIDRTWRQALRAANTALLVDHCEQCGTLDPIVGIEWEGRSIQQSGEALDRRGATRWALIDVGGPTRDGFGVGPAAGVAATGALRLRKQSVDVIRASHVAPAEPVRQAPQLTLMPGVAPESADNRNTPGLSPLAASTMPSDIPNFIFRGARLATITVRRPFSAAGS